jgi:hypothetical protein
VTERSSGSRARTRAQDPRPRPTAVRREGGRASEGPLKAAAQIVLGLGVSCLSGMIVMGFLGGVVLGILYLTK